MSDATTSRTWAQIYTACLSCSSPLPRNESFELVQTGHRIAFDGEKGRLWILCASCRAWNLAPIEERWEAVEAAERLFERATIGASTENVTLGRLPDGLELIRVGRAEAVEFAGWRYGSKLLARRRQFWKEIRRGDAGLWLVGAAGVGGVVAGFPWAAFAVPAYSAAVISISGVRTVREARRPAMLIHAPDPVVLSSYRVSQARLIRVGDDEWAAAVTLRTGRELRLRGDDGVRFLRRALPLINGLGGSPEQVRRAVHEVEQVRSAEDLLEDSARRLEQRGVRFGDRGRPGRIARVPPTTRLAIEIAANEEIERRALAGEVRGLEQEWRNAEELAAISDNLLVPRTVVQRTAQWRSG